MFISPDSLIPDPGNPQDLNRYSYTRNNPLRYTDPMGHNPNDPWHALGLYNPFEAIARYFGVPDFSQDGVPAYEDLTTDIGKTYIETFAAANQVIIPPVETALNYVPGISSAYQAATAVSGSTILGQPLSPGERAQNAVFAAVGVIPSGDRGAKFGYDVKAGRYRDLETGRFISPKDLPWPGNRGFADSPVKTVLSEGTVIDRYGSLTGQYAGTPGTTIAERGMAAGTESLRYTRLEVIKPLTVLGGRAAAVPAFGARGGAIQYYLEGGLQKWIDLGYLRIVP
jgi:hypothetical protein